MCCAPLPRASLVLLLLFFAGGALAQEPSPRPPLRETDIVKLLVSRVSPIRLRSLIKKYGIDFRVDASLDVLRAAGAEPDLIEALRAAEPVPTPTEIPPAPAAPVATPTRASRAGSPAPSLPALEQDFVLVRGGPKGDVYLARHEVTNQEYWEYCQRWNLPRPAAPPLGKPKARWPVVNVTFEEAERYCGGLRRETGHKYRLPTEIEWELGASGGDPRRRYPWGDDSPKGRACFGVGALCPVEAFKPNALGLFDMAGSVAEWVIGKAGDRAVKGGSWQTVDDFRALEISSRVKMDPRKRSYKVGFRVAIDP